MSYTKEEKSIINLIEIIDKDCKENPEWKTLDKCYKKLSLMYHPDKNPGNTEAEEKFKTISELRNLKIKGKYFDEFRKLDFNDEFYNILRNDIQQIKGMSMGRAPQNVPRATKPAARATKPFVNERVNKQVQCKMNHFMNVVIGVAIFVLIGFISDNMPDFKKVSKPRKMKEALIAKRGGGNMAFRKLWVTMSFIFIAAIANFGDAQGFMETTSKHINQVTIDKENDFGEFGSLFINGVNEMSPELSSLVPNQTPIGEITTRDRKIIIPSYIKWPSVSLIDIMNYLGFAFGTIALSPKMKKALEKIGLDSDIVIKYDWKTKFNDLTKVVDTINGFNENIDITNKGIVEKPKDATIEVSVTGMIKFIRDIDKRKCPIMKFGNNGYPTPNQFDKFIIEVVRGSPDLEGIKMKNRILECISLGFTKRITHEVIKIIDEMDKVYKKNETSTGVKEIDDSDILEYEKGVEVMLGTITSFNTIAYFNTDMDNLHFDDAIVDEIIKNVTTETKTLPYLINKVETGAKIFKKMNEDIVDFASESITVWAFGLVKAVLVSYPRSLIFGDNLPNWVVLLISCVFYFFIINYVIFKIGHCMALTTACVLDPGSLTGENDKRRQNNLAIEQEKTERERIKNDTELQKERIKSESEVARLEFYSSNPQLTDINREEPLLLTNSTRKNKSKKKKKTKRKTQKKKSNSSGSSGSSESNTSKNNL